MTLVLAVIGGAVLGGVAALYVAVRILSDIHPFR